MLPILCKIENLEKQKLLKRKQKFDLLPDIEFESGKKYPE